MISKFSKCDKGAVEMSLWLRALATRVEKLDKFPSTHMRSHSGTPGSEALPSSSDLQGIKHTQCSLAYTQSNRDTHKKIKKISYKFGQIDAIWMEAFKGAEFHAQPIWGKCFWENEEQEQET